MRLGLAVALCAAGCTGGTDNPTDDGGTPDLTVVYDFMGTAFDSPPHDFAGHDLTSIANMDSATDSSTAAGDMSSKADLEINYCIVQFPKMATAQAGMQTQPIYGQVYQQGLTDQTMNGPAPGILAQIGYGPAQSDPLKDNWTWMDAVPNQGWNWANNNDEYQAQLTINQAGSYWYVYRFSITNGAGWTYCDTVGNGSNGGLPAFDPTKSGQLTVN